jgi:long-chain fatty acid transport protein
MNRIFKGAAIAGAMLGAGAASAGGLWLNEYGDFAGGRAAAGAAAGTDEAMTIAYNPASISRMEGNQLFASAGAIIGNMNFDLRYTTPLNGTDDGGDAGETAPFASMAYLHDFDSDRWSAGVGLYAVSGAGIDYGDNWAGRFQATDVFLQVMAISPTVAYQVTEELSLGVTLQGYYADLEVKTAVPRPDQSKPEGKAEINGDDIRPGYALGAMYELSDRTRFGLAYQSELKPKFDGDFKLQVNDANVGELDDISRNISTNTELVLAEYVRFSVHQDMDERWAVDFTVGWDNWSAFKNVLIETQDVQANIPGDWRDTYHYAWGAQYKLDKYWTLTSGIAYDTNPIDASHRNAQLPVDRQVRYAAGARYALWDSLTVGGYVNYMDLGRARISGKRFGGEFDYNNATQLILNLNWIF